MTTKSTKQGWERSGRGHYTHETGVEVRKTEYVWEVVGGKNDGLAYRSLWVAMQSAAGTPAEWVR